MKYNKATPTERPTISDIWDIFWHIDGSGRLFRSLFFSSLLVIVIAAIIQNTIPRNPDPPSLVLSIGSTATVILISIATSVVAATMIEIFARMRDRWTFLRKQRQFRDFFNCDLESNIVAIVIPRFFPGVGQADSVVSESLSAIPNVETTINQLNRIGRQIVAHADIVAASDIIALFNSARLPIPDTIWDDEALAELKLLPQRPKYRTYIAIGLYSNDLTDWLAKKKSQSRLFKLDRTPDRSAITLPDYQGGQIDYDEARWTRKYESIPQSQEPSFGLVAKADLGVGVRVIVIGGLRATVTQRLGRFVREMWQHKLFPWRDLSNELSVMGNCFAGILRIPFEDHYEITNEYLIVHPNGTNLESHTN